MHRERRHFGIENDAISELPSASNIDGWTHAPEPDSTTIGAGSVEPSDTINIDGGTDTTCALEPSNDTIVSGRIYAPEPDSTTIGAGSVEPSAAINIDGLAHTPELDSTTIGAGSVEPSAAEAEKSFLTEHFIGSHQVFPERNNTRKPRE